MPVSRCALASTNDQASRLRLARGESEDGRVPRRLGHVALDGGVELGRVQGARTIGVHARHDLIHAEDRRRVRGHSARQPCVEAAEDDGQLQRARVDWPLAEARAQRALASASSHMPSPRAHLSCMPSSRSCAADSAGAAAAAAASGYTYFDVVHGPATVYGAPKRSSESVGTSWRGNGRIGSAGQCADRVGLS